MPETAQGSQPVVQPPIPSPPQQNAGFKPKVRTYLVILLLLLIASAVGVYLYQYKNLIPRAVNLGPNQSLANPIEISAPLDFGSSVTGNSGGGSSQESTPAASQMMKSR